MDQNDRGTTNLREYIIQQIFQNRIDVASEAYQKSMASLTTLDREEISYYANLTLDPEIVEVLFPGLLQRDEKVHSPKHRKNDDSNDDSKKNASACNNTSFGASVTFDRCCYSMKAYQLVKEKGTLGAIREVFTSFCLSSTFSDFISNWGLDGSTFSPNPFAVQGNKAYERFTGAIRKLENNATFELVFHGTRTVNINDILMNGLDPKKRRGQAYGPGEYFAHQPSTSVSYCHGGKSMLVFVVVSPNRTDPSLQTCPDGFVVVPINEHQLPLGTISFTSVDAVTLAKSQAVKQALAALSAEVERKTRLAEIGMIRAKIIQEIIRDNIHVAGEMYFRHEKILSEPDKRQISMYAHRLYDPEVVSFYFVNIPSRMELNEYEVVQNVDSMVSEADTAKEQLEAKRKELQIYMKKTKKTKIGMCFSS